jgi:hypothetical protein
MIVASFGHIAPQTGHDHEVTRAGHLGGGVGGSPRVWDYLT